MTDPRSGESWDMVLSRSRDGSVRLWRIDPKKKTGEIYAVLGSKSDPVNGAALNDAGDQVMVWGDDGMVRRYYVYMDDLLEAVCRNNAQLSRARYVVRRRSKGQKKGKRQSAKGRSFERG